MKFKHERPWMYGIIALIPTIIIAVLFVSGVQYTFSFKNFKVEFAASTAYAQENDCLRAEYGGQVMRITPYNANSIYAEIANGGFAEFEHDAPSESGLFLDYGDDATMQVWSAGETGLIVHYTNDDTDMFYRTTDDSSFDRLERLVSADWGNAPWDDAD